jgi:hypothetical protein
MTFGFLRSATSACLTQEQRERLAGRGGADARANSTRANANTVVHERERWVAGQIGGWQSKATNVHLPNAGTYHQTATLVAGTPVLE